MMMMQESSFDPLQKGEEEEEGGGARNQSSIDGSLGGPLEDLLASYRESFASLGSVAQSVTRLPSSDGNLPETPGGKEVGFF